MNTTWYLQSHAVWLKLWYSSIGFLLFVYLAAHVPEFLRWTPLSVKLLLPPRQSRGASYFGLVELHRRQCHIRVPVKPLRFKAPRAIEGTPSDAAKRNSEGEDHRETINRGNNTTPIPGSRHCSSYLELS